MSILVPLGPPDSEAELLERARALGGRTLQAVADAVGHRVPPDTVRAKGWVGQLVEDALGAAAGNRPVPDFERIGVELKTVPVDPRGYPRESTYVTSLPLSELGDVTFVQSNLQKKLAKVLFVPVEAHPNLPLPVRRLGMPLLWRPSEADHAALAADWEAFAAKVRAGEVDSIGPRMGEVLQVRPKGADAQDHATAVDAEGRAQRTMRRGLYLRPGFVRNLFARHFHMPADSGPIGA